MENKLSNLLIDQSKDVIWMIDLDFNLIYANKSYLKRSIEITGAENKLNKSVFEGFDEEAIQKWKACYNRAIAGECFEIEEHYAHLKTNEIQYSQITFEPITGDHNKIIAIACQSRDITRIVKQKSEANYSIDANKELDFQTQEKKKIADELIIANKELAFQTEEKKNRADELIIANKELAFQTEEKKNRADELIIANKELAFQTEEKKNRADELIIANKELAFQTEEKKNRADELIIANKELAFQTEEKKNRADELIIANKELAFQTEEKKNRADELIIADQELAFQTEEKKDRADELIIADQELAFQTEEKKNRADELIIANQELAFQTSEKKNRADELIIANQELAFQTEEKKNRADELIIANKELDFQNEEKKDRADELIIADKELAFQNEEKKNRADELIIADKELAFQTLEKKNRADELIIANKELAFQTKEKKNRADELIIANKELAFQTKEKKNRVDELIIANKELAFQTSEKKNRADELIIANKELAFQTSEKKNRADELIIANKELAFQNEEKKNRADELIIADKQIIIQFNKKKKIADELIIANKETIFENNRANQLTIANKALSDFKYALDQSSIIAITDQKGIINHVNENFCKISKYAADELIGQDHKIISSGYHSKEFIKDLWKTITHGKIWRGELKNRAKDGTIYWVDTTIVPFLNEKGKPTQYLSIRSDITEQKKMQIHEEKLLEDIIQRNKNLEQFSYIISHNLRLPVANILGLTSLLKEDINDSESMDYINNSILISANKLDEVIKDLNDILQAKNNVSEIKELVNFTNLASDIYAGIDALINKENTTITLDFSEVPEMRTIKSYLYSIFYNLISNSLKYRQIHVPLLIEMKSQLINNKIILLFKDNGIGIDLTKQSNMVFGLYKRFHTDHAEGKGIGLFMVKTQVETIGGSISIKSEVNKGTEFRIEFPLQ